MLDKSIEWLRVILKRNPGTPLPPVLLPQGYAFVTYQEGDEQAWSEIEVSARTFETWKRRSYISAKPLSLPWMR